MFVNDSTRKWIAALIIVLVYTFSLRPHMTRGQEPLRKVPATQIAIDEDILAAFVDEPCSNFEAARDQFVAGDSKQAAKHLQTAAAFLRLEAARSTPDGKIALDASIAEIKRLAVAIQNNQIESVQRLEQAFASAHFALASHHCIKSSHRCCRPGTFQDKQDSARVGWDLKAATIHYDRGSLWAGNELDEETRNLIAGAQLTANQLIQQGSSSQSEVQRTIHALHGKLERISGLKILLAPPLAENERAGLSILR